MTSHSQPIFVEDSFYLHNAMVAGVLAVIVYLSVCLRYLCVCHTPVSLCQNGCTDRAGFIGVWDSLDPLRYTLFKEIGVLFSGILSKLWT